MATQQGNHLGRQKTGEPKSAEDESDDGYGDTQVGATGVSTVPEQRVLARHLNGRRTRQPELAVWPGG